MKAPSSDAVTRLLNAGFEESIFSCAACRRNGIAYIREDTRQPLVCICGQEVVVTIAPRFEQYPAGPGSKHQSKGVRRMDNLQMKFRCTQSEGEETSRTVRLGAVTGPENELWATATPTASLETTIAKPGAASFFKEGREYIATFQEV